jgi:hypothetical protein
MCEHVVMPNGDRGLICGVRGGGSPALHCFCGRAAEALCDWKVPAKKSGTCDSPICGLHSKQVARGKHLCPEHQRSFEDWKRRNPPAQGSLFQEWT